MVKACLAPVDLAQGRGRAFDHLANSRSNDRPPFGGLVVFRSIHVIQLAFNPRGMCDAVILKVVFFNCCRGGGISMGRKIILLSDGTGNSAAKVWRTNVWRTFEALDLSGNDQVAFYDDGVGTSSFKPMAVLGGAFGLGLRRNVIALYKFACRNYRDAADEPFRFGFSRGAFTIRIVMGMIDSQGLVKADSEAELHSLASAAYRAYRRDRYHHLKLEAPYQWIRNRFGPVYPPKDPQKVRKNI